MGCSYSVKCKILEGIWFETGFVLFGIHLFLIFTNPVLLGLSFCVLKLEDTMLSDLRSGETFPMTPGDSCLG